LIIEFVAGREDAILGVAVEPPKESGVQFEKSETAPGQGETRIDMKLFLLTEDKQRLSKGPWPMGDYYADLYIDGGLEKTVAFSVVEDN
jgi:hypothetical protein